MRQRTIEYNHAVSGMTTDTSSDQTFMIIIIIRLLCIIAVTKTTG